MLRVRSYGEGLFVSFPQLQARTRRFTHGLPQRFQIRGDGRQMLFTRTRAGDDPIACLWLYDVAARSERLLLDPRELAVDDGDLPAAERRRRERARETGGGVIEYSCDADQSIVAVALGGELVVLDPATGATRTLPSACGVVDPRPDPNGRSVGFVSGGGLYVVDVDGTGMRTLAAPEAPQVSYGLAEHVAAESMHRRRGWWWAPDGQRLVAARVDESSVQVWHLANPADPTATPVTMRYPAAGTANADVSLVVLGLDGSRVEVDWNRKEFEYLTAVTWDRNGLTIAVQNRSQSCVRVLRVDPDTGASHVEHEQTDPAWVSLVPGVPARTADGALVWTADTEDTRHLLVGGEPVTPPGLQVHEILDVDGDIVLFAGSTDPTERHVWTWSAVAGLSRLTAPGVHDGHRAGGTTVLMSRNLDEPDPQTTLRTVDGSPARLTSHAQRPPLTPRVDLFEAGPFRLRTAVILPTGYQPEDGPLPVLMDPYGGPAGQRVLAAQSVYLTSQWFADQGFAVVIVDGRGTPGRGPRWERLVHGDRGTAPLEDQVDGLREAARRYPQLDLTRVGIRGWSYGGYLAALAVLRRPDVFHAAIAGAAVVDQRRYDTHWQERFLGHPDDNPEAYDRNSLLGYAPELRRPLLLIHGLLDDNVHPTHTLQLSAKLLAAGRPHNVLPLPSGTHMISESYAARLLDAQVDFLRTALGTAATVVADPDRTGAT
ncbi:S9 family peptidase [Plantactinospora sp. KLBMP9567]|uniref:S9 family peptidase n=1 Tax=Plantactinospora sp. KLBMP9567 TaxID=3085900 RepID=UPI00298299C5|nr:prolyl oligopeptidase family serine peptidase [Plantactinospora sp. KLBMP9567]MDW5328849.1 prolyl oligopeptidase family serine peptidase [Plantactinospora sp. KLBMP9567]